MSQQLRLTEPARDDREEGSGTLAPKPAGTELSIPRVVAGALAAASAAVAASWLGVAGTVLGAVVASVVASVGNALYTRSIERSSDAIRETLPALSVLPTQSRDTAGWSGATPAPASPSAPSRTRRIRWGGVALSAVLTLVLGLAILTGVEALTGKAAASLHGGDKGGTTVTQIFGGSASSDEPGKPSGTGGTSQAPTSPAPTTDGATSEAPTTQAPTTQAPTTEAPTTQAPTTEVPSDVAPGTTAPAAGQTATGAQQVAPSSVG